MGSDFRVGLIVPSSNTVMEPDLHRALGPVATVSTTRIYLEEVTRAAEETMLRDELPLALRLIQTTDPDVVVFGCTSAGSLGGLAHDAGIARRIEQQTQARAVTVVGSLVEQLALLRPRRVAVFTPYAEELTQSVSACVAEAGYPLAKTAGMGLRENRAIGRVTPEEIIAFVSSHARGLETDCVFLSCTNWQALGALEPLRARLGVPMLTSNQAVIEAVRRLLPATVAR
jgi:maleate isomerase